MLCRHQLAQLRRHASEFADLHATVLTITFGAGSRMEDWLQETQSPFVLLLDRRRTAYEAYAVRRSLTPVNIAAVRRGRELAKQGERVRGIQGDPFQLGGTFVIDHAGIVRFAHRSSNSMEYPAPAELLSVLKGLMSPQDAEG